MDLLTIDDITEIAKLSRDHVRNRLVKTAGFPPPTANARMIKVIVHWLVAIALVLQLFSCIFMGQSFMPAQPF